MELELTPFLGKIRRFIFGPQAIPHVDDKTGHYDIDGVSQFNSQVIVSGDDSEKGLTKDQEFLPLSEKSIKDIEGQADSNSMKLKNQISPADDGCPDKRDVISSAHYTSVYEEYLQFEKAGD